MEIVAEQRDSGRDNHVYALSAWLGSSAYRYLNGLSLAGGVVPSTGFYAAVAAFLTCRRVSLYAFGDALEERDHYWGQVHVHSGLYDKHVYPLEELVYLAAVQNVLLLPPAFFLLRRAPASVAYRVGPSHRRYCHRRYVNVTALPDDGALRDLLDAPCGSPTTSATTTALPAHKALHTAPPHPATLPSSRHHHHHHPQEQPRSSAEQQSQRPATASLPPRTIFTRVKATPLPPPYNRIQVPPRATTARVQPTRLFVPERLADPLRQCSGDALQALVTCDTNAVECLGGEQPLTAACSCFDAWTYCHLQAKCGFNATLACDRIGASFAGCPAVV